MLVTLLGIVMLVRLLQPKNAPDAIILRDLGNTMVLIPLKSFQKLHRGQLKQLNHLYLLWRNLLLQLDSLLKSTRHILRTLNYTFAL